MLARLGVVTERGGQIYPTVAGMIALGKRPYWFIPGMRVELNLEGEEVCWRGSLSTLVDQASCATAPCLRTASEELREILLNAILHRDWRVDVRDLPIKIDVSDGYLEASHPGGTTHQSLRAHLPRSPGDGWRSRRNPRDPSIVCRGQHSAVW